MHQDPNFRFIPGGVPRANPMRPRRAIINPAAPPHGPPQAIVWELADWLEKECRRKQEALFRRWGPTVTMSLALVVLLVYLTLK